MSKQTRYEKPFEIQADILRLKRRMKERLEEVMRLDALVADNMKKAGLEGIKAGERQFFLEQADEMRKKSHKISKSINAIEENQIPRLVRTMAELKTTPMPFLTDGSVVKSK